MSDFGTENANSCKINSSGSIKERFSKQSGGKYSHRLFKIAGDGDLEKGKKLVMAELEDYWSRPFTVRSGFGMGWTRLTRAMRNLGLFPENLTEF